MRKILAITIFAVILFFGFNMAEAATRSLYLKAESGLAKAPEVVLIKPISTEVALKGEKELGFEWSPHEGSLNDRDYYDFRLYRGYDMVESTLIQKKKIPPNVYNISLDAGIFENGNVYTWSLRQIYHDSRKSDKSWHSFKVIK
jgi:hypothetical protein